MANPGDPFVVPGVSAVTCTLQASQPPASAFTLGFFDLRNPPVPLYNSNVFGNPAWNAPVYHHPDWTVDKIGTVFGLAIDDDGDVYAAAHGLYPNWGGFYYKGHGGIGGGATSLAAAGTIYKIDRLTGAPTVFSVIPGQQAMALDSGFTTGPGLGNIAYDAKRNQFFVTNLEDGKIYRIGSAGGPPIDSFDPLGPDSGAAGMAPRDERLWGIGVLGDTVYYAVWNTGNSVDPGEIRSVDLTGTGMFNTGTDQSVLSVPPSTMSFAQYVPVSDITFSKDGTKMLFAERTMASDVASYNHASRVHWAELVSSAWVVQRTLEPGGNPVGYSQGEAYGGVAYGQDGGLDEQVIWMSSADTAANSSFSNSGGPHGLFGLRPIDFPVGPAEVPIAFRVPYDPSFNGNGPDVKGSGGDIVIMQQLACATFEIDEIKCPERIGDPYTVTVSITNNSNAIAEFARFTPCPSAELPAGTVTIPPTPSVITLPAPIPIGGTGTVVLTIPAPPSGGKNCFLITLLDGSGNVCCTEKLCIDLPRCDCAELVDTKITCELLADGTIKYTLVLTVRNRTDLSADPYPFWNTTILPPAGFSPADPTPVPNPIPPGGTGTITTCYFGVPGPLKFTLSLHDEILDKCCSIEDICLKLPECAPGSDKPDRCAVDRRVACCPPTFTATITYTVKNNSSVARTYSWNAAGFPKPGCTQSLTAANFVPSSGTLGPVPPGGTATATITVRCDGFAPLDCAGFEICASYNAAVPPLCCRGEVYAPKDIDPTVKTDHGSDDGKGGLPDIPTGALTPLSFSLANPTDVPVDRFLIIMDESGALLFEKGAGAAPQSQLTVPVTIPARATASATVIASRVGIDPPGLGDFSNLIVWLVEEDYFNTFLPGLDLEPIDLITPVHLGTAATPGFQIVEFALVLEPDPQVKLTIPTVAGRRYRIQESTDLRLPWVNSNCSVIGATVDADGMFVGSGDGMVCLVPCDTDEPRRFYRAMCVLD